MESGWARFKANHDYEPAEDKEIPIAKEDILIVAKPYGDPKGWLVGKNERTGEFGEIPGTYVEYIGDVEEIEEAVDDELPPPIPPRPPKPEQGQVVRGGHKLMKVTSSRPLFCFHCEDFIWGNDKEYYKCPDCQLTCHLQCVFSLQNFPCNEKVDVEEECIYEHLVGSVEEWSAEDVLTWLATTNYYTIAESFREFGIDGSKLNMLNEKSLVQMGINDQAHQQSLLYTIEELYSGSSPERESAIFSGFQKVAKGSDGEHHFRVQNFYSLQWCDQCGKCLWGLYQQGLQCFVCGLCCHRMCMKDGIVSCPRRRIKAIKDSDVDVPSFGQELSVQFRPSTKPAPLVVTKCVEAIEKIGLKTEGIYSNTPQGPEKYNLRAALNQDAGQVNMSDQEWRDPLCIATVLKMYFQELPSCLFTEERYADFVEVCRSHEDDQICADNFLTLIDSVPSSNKSVIHYLMKHLYKVSQNQQFTKMSSTDLARIFATILLRPMKKDLIKMALNHDMQIRVIDILINKGPWSKEKVDIPPPVVPPRPPRRGTVKISSVDLPEPPQPAPQESSDLKTQIWYWGEASKEQVQERMTDTDDGTFIVRDSKRYPGEYTLTLRKGGVSKLIRIMYKNNKYGFSEPLTFSSVVEMVSYYRDKSLAQYNAKLDVRLSNPLSKYERDVGLEQESEIMDDLEKISHELDGKSDEYDRLQTDYNELTKNIADLQSVLDAHKSVVSMINDQLHVHETFQKEAAPQMRAMLRQNFELLKHRLNDANCELLQSQRDLSNITEESRQKDQLMNTLRSLLVELQKKKQHYMDMLTDKGMSHDEVKEIANEGIYQGTIYQIPDIDMSEANWKFGKVTRNHCEELLRDCPDGTFLIRESIKDPGYYRVSLSFNFIVRHIEVLNGPRGFGFSEPFTDYPTLTDLVNHYHRNTLQKHNKHLATKLVFPVGWYKNKEN